MLPAPGSVVVVVGRIVLAWRSVFGDHADARGQFFHSVTVMARRRKRDGKDDGTAFAHSVATRLH